MKEKINLGIVAFVRNTYDAQKGQEIYKQSLLDLENTLDNVDLFGWQNVVEYPDELEEVLTSFKEHNVDGVVLLSATFHLGQLALKIAKNINKPFLIWALPEPSYHGERLRLNSLVGAHLDCSNLYKSGFDNFEFIYGETKDPDFKNKLNNWLDALRIIKKWNNTKIGLIGNHAQGFYNIDVYEPEIIKEFGAEIDFISLSNIFNFKANTDEIKKEMNNLSGIYNHGENMTDERLEKVANLYICLKELEKSNNYTAMAIRCWPEFANTYGISPCASMSYFMPEHIPIACEGDIEGTLGMIAYKAVGCNELFLADISQIFEKEDSLLFWHCGVAPYNLWDQKSEKTLDTYFAGGRGVTVGFVLKPGPVTISRIDYARGKTRLLTLEGEALPTEKELKGTYVKVKIPDAKNTFEKFVSQGVAHHVVLGYGRYKKTFEKVAKLKNWEIL